jgi:hypothetical protein
MPENASPALVTTQHGSDEITINGGNEAETGIPFQVQGDSLQCVVVTETHSFCFGPQRVGRVVVSDRHRSDFRRHLPSANAASLPRSEAE